MASQVKLVLIREDENYQSAQLPTNGVGAVI